MIYLDNAATSFPKPPQVIASMVAAQRDIGASPGRGGHTASRRAGEIVYRLRQELGEMFYCDSDRVAFTLNCTHALNTAICGILKAGDHVIISSLEHNSVLRPVHRLRGKGVRYSVARVEADNEELTVENFRRLINKNTKAIICTVASNVFGTVLPVEKIGELCRRRGLIFVADGAQAVGHTELDMKKMNIDILCMPGHKGLLGPMGTGAIMLREGISPEPLMTGGTGSHSMDKEQPRFMPDALESGTLNFPGLAGLLSGVRYVKRFGGVGAVHEKESEDIRLIEGEIANIKGVTLYPKTAGKNRTAVLPFNVGNLHSEEVAMLLDGCGIGVRGGYHCAYIAHSSHGTADKGAVRVSPGIFTSKKDIKNFIFCLNKIAKGEVM